jgi:flagellar biosynthetic protein FlhB
MPADTGDKTEAPTPRKREDARRRGQVSKSTDLSSAVILLGAVVLLNFTVPDILGRLSALIRFCLAGAGRIESARDAVLETVANAGLVIVTCVLPVMLTVAVLALLVNVAQVGWLFTGHPLIPSLSKINPLSGLRRIFSMRNLVRLAMSVGKIALIGAVAYLTLRGQFDQIVRSSNLDHLLIVMLGGRLLFILGMRLAMVLLVLAILDYIWNRYKHEQDLRMTKEEVKEEMRRMEGDPVVRQRRRRVQMQLTLQRMGIEVPKSDVVITNPTEIAVAIRYDEASMNAPKVVAKGKGLLAERIRQLAVQHGVPIVERKPLAQALYRAVEVGQEVPPQFYRAIAEILAYVYELAGRGRQVAAPAT